jgi:hypothetical protein
MSKTNSVKTERQEMYKERNTQLLIGKFLSGELNKLEPSYDNKKGYTYPVVEEIVGDASQVNEFLNRLVETGILKKEIFDKVICCPNCNSPNISIHYCCPHCKSFDIVKSSLIEHVSCGYIDVEENFRQGRKLVCPRCRKELTKPDIDHRKAGMWCRCNTCNKNFDIPVTSHFCRQCQTTFLFEDAIYQNVYSYSLTEEARQEASVKLVILEPIRKFLEQEFEVEIPGFLKGKSGANHMFDIVAFSRSDSEKVMVMDITTSSDIITEQPVIAMFAKIYDVAPDKACLIAIPKINENGKKMAALYKIELVEAEEPTKIVKILETRCLKRQEKSKKD